MIPEFCIIRPHRLAEMLPPILAIQIYIFRANLMACNEVTKVTPEGHSIVGSTVE